MGGGSLGTLRSVGSLGRIGVIGVIGVIGAIGVIGTTGEGGEERGGKDERKEKSRIFQSGISVLRGYTKKSQCYHRKNLKKMSALGK